MKCWVGLSLCGILLGCGKPISKSDLPGVYQADYGFATDTLRIEPDGHFTQTIKVKADGKTATTRGTWRFDQKDHEIRFNERMVVINGFSEMVTNFDAPTNRNPSSETVRRRWGKLEIGGDDWLWGRTGVEAPYKKQPSKPAKWKHVPATSAALQRRIRVLLWIFIAGLVLSGSTAIPLETGVNMLARIMGASEGW